MSRIHATAVIDSAAELASGVSVGAYAVIGPGVFVGADTEVGAGAQLQGPTTLGEGNRIFSHACIGFDPQDLKYAGEASRLEVGDGNTFREFCTVHRGTRLGGNVTSIGSDNLFMAYTHVAHDCHVGDRTIFGNAATLAGHVEVQSDAILSAFCAVHQFCRVGRFAYIGGFSVITMDAMPYVRTVGQKPVCLGINRLGLQRKGFDEARMRILEQAFRIIARSGLNAVQALERLEGELAEHPDAVSWAEFLRSSERGVIRAAPGRRGGRGEGDG
jgi:UDP-N-acetylglucosamine acyltransferase